MKVTMEFDLPDEQAEFEAASHAGDMLSAITDFDNILRNVVKHGTDKVKVDLCESLRKDLWDHINDHGVAHLFE